MNLSGINLETFFNSSNDIFGVLDSKGIFIKINPAWTKILGWTEKDLIGNSFNAITESELKNISGNINQNITSSFKHKGGHRVEVSWTSHLDDTTNLYFFSGRDITLEIKQQKFLESERKKFEALVYGLDKSAIVAVTDHHGKIIMVNDKFSQISGYSKEELIGTNHRLLKSGFHPDSFFEEMWQTISSGKVWHGEICNRRKDGTLYWVDSSIVPVTIEGTERQYISVRFDVSDRKTAEKKLLQSSKMASLGEMAGGIAHEINNPLAIIRGKAELLKMLISKPGFDVNKPLEFLDTILATTDRIANIVKGLRTFSRSSESDPFTKVSLKSLIDDTLSLCQTRMKNHGIEFTVSDIPNVEIECRPAQISQILINLVGNSHDAILGSEKMWIKLEAQTLPNGNVGISVTDSGLGIKPEIADKVLEPFFTTKPIGKGTGLGLSLSLGLAQSHHGNLFLDRKSKNTKFILELPLVQNADAAPKAA